MLLVVSRQTPCLLNTIARVRSTFTGSLKSRVRSTFTGSLKSSSQLPKPNSRSLVSTAHIMGRWRGNKRRIWKAKDGSSSTNGGGTKDADASNKNVIWSWKQEKEVIAYLTAYRQEAERVYQQDYGSGDSGTTRQNAAVTSKHP
jgi:hypothetical protein